ncbi:MAG: biotin--[acetyl-CoA-carboxylase] ligase [Gallionella sp.]|nr:biotin--[acetyl-CoA-carboxylase] ligase [Gallionella sp.]
MTPRTWQLLRLLADGEFHSGEVLGRQLGVSRATVFGALSQLSGYGIALQRIRGRGYRLPQPWVSLDAVEINRSLSDMAGRFQLEILQQAASSNTELLRRAVLGAPSGYVLGVELQTAGRGRLGRPWHTGLGNALTFSLLWRFDCGLNALSGLSLAVGLAIRRALVGLGAAGVNLKWPNDILAQGVNPGWGKLGGVLIEAQGDMYGPSCVVIGIGINCTLPQVIERAITQSAVSLDQLCRVMPARAQILAALLRELACVLDEFSRTGFAGMRAEWEQHHAQQDLPVRLNMPDGASIFGIARGVSDSGELRLETTLGISEFNAGEVGVGS